MELLKMKADVTIADNNKVQALHQNWWTFLSKQWQIQIVGIKIQIMTHNKCTKNVTFVFRMDFRKNFWLLELCTIDELRRLA